MEFNINDVITNLGVPGSFGAMTVLAVWMLLTGRVVPMATVKQYTVDRDYWKAAYESEKKANVLLSKVAEEMLEQGKTTQAFLSKLVSGGDLNKIEPPKTQTPEAKSDQDTNEGQEDNV